MFVLTYAIPDTHFRVPQRFVKSLIETYRQDQFTGLVQLRYPSGADLVSVFWDGMQQRLYRCLNDKMEAIPRQTWSHFMDRPDASIASLKLPVEALRFVRVVHEAPILHTERLHCKPKELTPQLGTWVEEKQPSILHVHSESGTRIYLIAGHSMPVIEELVLSGSDARYFVSDASFPTMFPDQDIQATRYLSDSEHEAWQEYELRFAFHPLMRMLINRFSDLAGRALTERLCEKISMQLRDRGWRISVSMNGVANHHYFDSFEEAKYSYIEIMRSFHSESSQAIGARLVNGLTGETLLKLGPRRSELLKRQMINNNGLDGGAGRTWR